MISSCAQIAEIDADLAAYYEITQDLDCSSQGDAIKVAGTFTGVLDGGDHTLTINLDEQNGSGNTALFQSIPGEVHNLKLAGTVTNTHEDSAGVAALAVSSYGGTFRDIDSTVAVTNPAHMTGGLVVSITDNGSMDNVHVSANITGNNVGGIATWAACDAHITNSSYSGTITATDNSGGITAGDGCEGSGATLENVTSSGTINAPGADKVGGIIGDTVYGTIHRASSSMAVHGKNMVGGLIGYVYSSNISQSSAIGAVTAADSHAGGLIGQAEGGDISESYAKGNVQSTGDYTGGLIGETQNTQIADSYARGNVTGADYVGGFVGQQGGPMISDVYSTGVVTSPGSKVGGFGGQFNGAVIQFAFWDMETSGMTSTLNPANGRTTSAMKTKSTFTTLLGVNAWDFDEIWAIGEENDGYPCLQWSESCTEGEEQGSSSNGQGASAAIEDAGPNNGDANNDGTKDSLQANVASFVNPANGQYAVVALPSSCSITNTSADSEDSTAKDAAYSYKTGLVNFSANCAASSIEATVYQYGISKDGLVLRKFDPTNGTYFTIEGAVLSDQTIGNKNVVTATYTITDNGVLDLDPASGKITDPVGLANLTVGIPNTGLGGRH